MVVEECEGEEVGAKKEVMGFWLWRKGLMPLMFQEKMRRVSRVVAVVEGEFGAGVGASVGAGASFRRFVGGGLISPGIVAVGVLFDFLR